MIPFIVWKSEIKMALSLYENEILRTQINLEVGKPNLHNTLLMIVVDIRVIEG